MAETHSLTAAQGRKVSDQAERGHRDEAGWQTTSLLSVSDFDLFLRWLFRHNLSFLGFENYQPVLVQVVLKWQK